MISAKYMRVGGTLAFVEQQGEGPAVLCLHTAGQSGVQWRFVTDGLARLGYRVIVPDLPGHGRSEPAPDGPVTNLGDYADWCAELLDVLGLEDAYVAGCSIGGKVALEMAVKHGHRLAGIVSMAAHGGVEAGRNLVGERGLRRDLEDSAAPSRTDRTYYGTLAVVGRSVPREKALTIAAMHRREDPEVSTSDLIGWATQDVRDKLPGVVCPAHLIVGDDDLWLDPADVQAAAELIPSAQYTLLEGIGHYPMEEIEDFHVVLDGWLKGLPARREAGDRSAGVSA